MGADRTASLGADPIVRNGEDARRFVDRTLNRYGGPCSQAYADVLSAYIAAPEWGRAALFLSVAYQAVGVTPPSQSRTVPGSRATSAPDRSRQQTAEWMGRGLVPPRQERS